MDYQVRDNTTKRIITVSAEELKSLGGNFQVIAAVKDKAPPLDDFYSQGKASVKDAPGEDLPLLPEEPVEPPREMTRQQLIDEIKKMNLGLKSIHLYSFKRLKETYESNI